MLSSGDLSLSVCDPCSHLEIHLPMKALHLAHAYLIGATIHTPQGNRSPTKEEVIRAILEELNQQSKTNPKAPRRIRPDDRRRDFGDD